MHIPDGFLSATVAASTWAGGAASLAWSLRAERSLPDRTPAGTLGALAAFTFAAQLVNVPILPGTSGHLVGGTLAAAIVGPSRGLLVMAVVLAVQALLFQDGGVTAYGANLLSMGAFGAFGGYAVSTLVARLWPGIRGLVAGPVIGAFVATLAGASFVALALSASGLYPMAVVLPLLLSLHVPIALIEAALTGAILATLARWRPDLLHGRERAGARAARPWGCSCWRSRSPPSPRPLRRLCPMAWRRRHIGSGSPPRRARCGPHRRRTTSRPGSRPRASA